MLLCGSAVRPADSYNTGSRYKCTGIDLFKNIKLFVVAAVISLLPSGVPAY